MASSCQKLADSIFNFFIILKLTISGNTCSKCANYYLHFTLFTYLSRCFQHRKINKLHSYLNKTFEAGALNSESH